MLKPNSVYDLVVEAVSGRSIDMEPLTFHSLRKVNPGASEKLKDEVRDGRTFLVATTYAHNILPLLAEESQLDALINVAWGLRLHKQVLGSEVKTICFWLSECAYTAQAAAIILQAVEEIFGLNVKTLLLLDELQTSTTMEGKVYSANVGSKQLLILFRSRWLSDAYAFSPDYEGIMNTLRGIVGSSKPDAIGVIVDAETYGGAYEEQKPDLLMRLRTELKNGLIIGEEAYQIEFKNVGELSSEASESKEALIRDYTAWSDYEDYQIFRADRPKTGTIVSSRAGGLCRWTGHLRDADGKPTRETYFIVTEWVQPKTKKRYVRVLSSIWKVAFNTIRTTASSKVRAITLKTLKRLAEEESVEEMLKGYGGVVLGEESAPDFIRRRFPHTSDREKRALELVLRAYKYANQDAAMSCPTFWQNIDTEVSWTSLAYLAGGLTLAATARLELGDEKEVEEIAEIYQRVFFDFESTFQHLIDDYDIPLDILYDRLREGAKLHGYDVEAEIAEAGERIEEEAEAIAKRLYQKSLGRIFPDRPFLENDANKFLILWIAHQRRNRVESGRAYKEAKLFEWRKAIGSAVSAHPLPVRVGAVHAKHFPHPERFLHIPTSTLDTGTEIIIGESHAYDP